MAFLRRRLALMLAAQGQPREAEEKRREAAELVHRLLNPLGFVALSPRTVEMHVALALERLNCTTLLWSGGATVG
jgi:hypothetical protein